jgi:hypothetical protein
MKVKKIVILASFLLSVSAISAQEIGGEGGRSTPVPPVSTEEAAPIGTSRPRPLRAEVQVESAFVRVLPLADAEPATSVFEDEILEVVGRNLDGLWFEVRRLGRMTNLGWIFNEMLEWEFSPTQLPLTDLTSGLVGIPVESDPGFAAFALENLNIRRLPLLQSERLGLVPISVTVPVFERNQDGSWLFINYLGVEGWINGYGVSPILNVLDIPMAMGLPPLPTANIVIIPPQIQLEQVERLRAYTLASRDLANNLASFWFTVFQGQTMPCSPPPFVEEYLYSGQDVRELPELQRYVPRLGDANYYLNTSIELLTVCGSFDPDVIRIARNSAVNARIIYDATLGLLDNLEENVIR